MGEFNYDLSQTFPEIPWVVNQQVSNTSLPVFYVTAALFYFFFFRMSADGSTDVAGSQWPIPKPLHASSLRTGAMKSVALKIQAQVSTA